MRLHPNTPAARFRAWPPAVQLGHAASELSRASALLETGATEEARRALLRARELLGVLETSPDLPAAWGPRLLDAARKLALSRLGDHAPATWQGVYASLMSLRDEPEPGQGSKSVS